MTLPVTLDPTITVPFMPRLLRLRELRQKAALSQADLAGLSGVSRGTIIRLEAGDPNVNPSTLRKLARALKVRPIVLMGLEDK